MVWGAKTVVEWRLTMNGNNGEGRKKSRAREHRDMYFRFEESLSHAILKEDPTNTNALQMLGNALTRVGKHQEAVKVDKTLVDLLPGEPIVHYNLACSYSNVDKPEIALKELVKAIELGYRDFKFMTRDPDLKKLRNDPRFFQLINKYVQRSMNA